MLGTFPFSSPGFAGIAVKNGGQTYYGWLRLEVFAGSGGYLDGLEVIDYAYNNVAGQSITAGEGASSTPEPGTAALSVLAAGALGIAALRRRRAELSVK